MGYPGTKELSLAQKLSVYIFLKAHTTDGKLSRGAIQDASEEFGVNRQSISKIKKLTKDVTDASELLLILKPKANSRGRKGYTQDQIKASVGPVPMNRRRTYRVLAKASKIPRSVLHRAMKSGKLWRHSSSVKPLLTEQNKVDRVKFSLSFVREQAPDLPFNEMFDTIHVDEKWFYLIQVNSSYILLPGEVPPQKKVKSKKFIAKVMFLAAVARPRWDHGRNLWFDGKLGIWPFVEWKNAKRTSRNRPAGTPELKPMNVDRDLYRRFLIEKVMPSIRMKMPKEWKNIPLFIQQDNARPHVTENDAAVLHAGKLHEWNITLRNQPANSPDLNVLDLGFFNAIQALQYDACATSISELVDVVIEAFDTLNSQALSDSFITLQAVMREILDSNGNNEYKIPHLKKQTHRRKGQEIVWIQCEQSIIDKAKKFLENNSNE